MEINNEKLTEYFNDIKEKSEIFSDMVNKVVLSYSGDLDALMDDLKIALTQPDAISTDGLERYYAELSNLIYFMADKVEKLNVFSLNISVILTETLSASSVSLSTNSLVSIAL